MQARYNGSAVRGMSYTWKWYSVLVVLHLRQPIHWMDGWIVRKSS